MRIVIDLQGAQAANRLRGIGRYSLSLALAIARQRGDHEIILALNGLFPNTIEPIRAAFDGVLPQDNIRIWCAPGPIAAHTAANKSRRLRAELIREAFLASLEPDLIHITSLFEGHADDAATSIGRLTERFPTSASLYDLVPHIYRDVYLTNQNMHDWYYEKFDHLRRAALLLPISESSGREVVTHLACRPENVVTAPCAVDVRFTKIDLDPAAKADLLRRYGIARPFAMYLGGDDPRKNMAGLVRAYARLPHATRRDHQLAIVCTLPADRRAALVSLACENGMSPDELALPGEVSDDDLTRLYNACTVFVFPSWHEGFGLPVLEAMSCGAPVIGADTSSIPEVIGRDDALFDARSDESISAKLQHVLTDTSFRNDLARYGQERAKTFSWDASARRALIAFERLHAERRPSQHPPRTANRRPRLAYVSPLPPDRSGIADYSAELLPELSRYYDIELISSKDRAKGHRIVPDMPLRQPNWLRRHADRFDRVLYHFGNSEFHDYMFDLLEDVPGTVVLHDFFLSGILGHKESESRWSAPWSEALYASHGYPALRERFQAEHNADVIYKYPTNLSVLQRAKGIIVHSNFSRHLASLWYGSDVGHDWIVVPLLRAPHSASDRSAARVALGVDADAFLICCFGGLAPLKLNHRALSAWLASELAKDENCHLVFVGVNYGGVYGASMRRAIEDSGKAPRIRITGWAEPDIYRQYLAAADGAIQLRALSRGETSGTALDCMNHGLATIVNACGSMAELPADAVWMLPEHFDDASLVDALNTLRHDPDRRAAFGARAREVIRVHHEPRACADAYADAIELFHERAKAGVPALIETIVQQEATLKNSECRCLAKTIAANHPALRPARRLFVDVSELVTRDAGSGIQRVTRKILGSLLAEPPEGFRVEPIYATPKSDGYRYARHFTLAMMGSPAGWATDDPVDPQIGDIFLGLDLNQGVTMEQAHVLDRYRAAGVRVYFIIYDLLPVLRPDCFPSDSPGAHARWLNTITRFDGIVTISQAVTNELQAWLAEHGPERLRPLKISWWHLGADIETSTPTLGLPRGAADLLARLKSAPTFVVVGTLEPRKGHAQALSAFELLWADGTDVHLVLVGKQGWMVEDLVKRISRHSELGKRLFWLNGISDEYLQTIYQASTCLLAPSEGEGFGLPLIEAARHSLPILARDMPVFREVAGDHASYFSGLQAKDLATAVRKWLVLFRAGRHPRSDAMPSLTWQQSTQKLLDVILRDDWAMTWPPAGNPQ